MSTIGDLHDLPHPHPEATVILPDGAGELRVRVTQVWAPEDLPSNLIVEVPAWGKWTQCLGGKEAHGVNPTTISMWVPMEAIRISKDAMGCVWDKLLEALNAKAAAEEAV
jgi:hypothetical protein